MNIPSDPVMLLGFVNLKLRDYYDSFDAMCEDMELDAVSIENKLMQIGYEYDSSLNQFV